ncbi:unnamed protein product [Somion occarium]|uniref:Uncharacterized protein n=1 Tax=Somion occarium TaxID=3059160 RepID=A0ABP1CRT4_9APHY
MAPFKNTYGSAPKNTKVTVDRVTSVGSNNTFPRPTEKTARYQVIYTKPVQEMVEVIGRGLPHDSIVVDGANAYTFWPEGREGRLTKPFTVQVTSEGRLQNRVLSVGQKVTLLAGRDSSSTKQSRPVTYRTALYKFKVYVPVITYAAAVLKDLKHTDIAKDPA